MTITLSLLHTLQYYLSSSTHTHDTGKQCVEVCNVGPPLPQHWLNLSRLLGYDGRCLHGVALCVHQPNTQLNYCRHSHVL